VNFRILFCQFIVILLLHYCVAYADERATEYKIKTAYLYNFAKFVKWPENRFISPNSDINICILENNPFKPFIHILNRKKAQGRRFNVITRPDTTQLKQCHMVFIPRSFTGDYKTVLKQTQALPILTIGEDTAFIHNGGIIAFIVQRDTVGFILNLDNAATANLTVSAKLAEVAKQVITK
jgi:hypothetical protein